MRYTAAMLASFLLSFAVASCQSGALGESGAVEKADADYKACFDVVRASPEAKLVYARLVYGDGKGVTAEKLSDKGKLSKAEKDAFVAMRQAKAPCDAIRHKAFREISSIAWQQPLDREIAQKHDALGLALLADESTVAQYNRAVIELNNQYDTDLARGLAEANKPVIYGPGMVPASPATPVGAAAPAGPATATGTQPRRAAAFLRSSYVAGQNRICIYDRLGNEEHTTIRSVDICPNTMH